jgi:prepilin-type N-terminal cleavage/methylation domain-containing protein
MRNRQKGFSLIELLIVVAIILIIAAIAIPNLIRSKMAANEASAVASIRTINTGEVVYSSTYNIPNVFSLLLQDLGDAAGTCATVAPIATNACLIDNNLATAVGAPGKSGYQFTYKSPAPGVGTYTLTVDAVTQGSTGTRGFFSDQTLVIRAKNPGPTATVADNPI